MASRKRRPPLVGRGSRLALHTNEAAGALSPNVWLGRDARRAGVSMRPRQNVLLEVRFSLAARQT